MEQGSKVNLTDTIMNNQSAGDFSFTHINVRCLMDKFDSFRISLSKNPLDIICLNEMLCDTSISDNESNLPNCSFVRRDRNYHGGKVALKQFNFNLR